MSSMSFKQTKDWFLKPVTNEFFKRVNCKYLSIAKVVENLPAMSFQTFHPCILNLQKIGFKTC